MRRAGTGGGEWRVGTPARLRLPRRQWALARAGAKRAGGRGREAGPGAGGVGRGPWRRSHSGWRNAAFGSSPVRIPAGAGM